MADTKPTRGSIIRSALRIAIKNFIRGVIRNQLLGVKDEAGVEIGTHLRKGDESCRGRIIPMSSHLIKKVRKIFKICRSEKEGDYTPVMGAAVRGLADMVWGFIECAKQTGKDLHTGETASADPLAFLWIKGKEGHTALDVALDHHHLQVAKLLLSNASSGQLRLEWKSKGKTLLPLLRDPIFNWFIFEVLEHEKRAEATMMIDNEQEESIVFDERGDSSPYTQLQRNETRNLLDKLDHGLLELNPSKNTVLHFVSESGYVKYVNEILTKDPSLIYSRNSDGETPAYVAAREGHVDILEIMINNLKGKTGDIESLVTRCKDKHNALHIAIQNQHAVLVFWLLQHIPQLANTVNDFNESPIFIAAERRYFAILELIVNKCEEKTFAGPNEKTALHAAAISNSPECVIYLLKAKRSLLYDKDKNGWTALHYAVYHNSSLATTSLLDVDYSIGYEAMIEGDINTSAVHIAASRGHCETMEVLMELCLGCSKFIDSKGRNILHVAVESKKNNVIEFIFRDESLTSLINQRDSNGNTPAHLLVASNFELMERVIDARVDLNVLSNKKLTPLDMTSHERRDILIKGIANGTNIDKKTSTLSPYISNNDLYEQELEAEKRESEACLSIVDNLVLVAALIATATFAAGFTVPGGFHSDDKDDVSIQGTPILLKKSAFQAFVVTDALAFSCSCSVLLCHVGLLIYRKSYVEAGEIERKQVDDKLVVMYVVTFIALLAMLIAFVTGLYVVLTPSLGLAIGVCVMALCIVMFLLSA